MSESQAPPNHSASTRLADPKLAELPEPEAGWEKGLLFIFDEMATFPPDFIMETTALSH